MNRPTHTLAMTAIVLGLAVSSAFAATDLDSRIENAARQTYMFRTYLKDDNVEVHSQNGIVTLTGSVSDPSHKRLAEDTVAALPGVKQVIDHLQVNHAATELSDDWISAKVKAALLFHRSVSAATQVFVTNGVVTLKGTAANQAQKDLTTAYTRDVDGVKSVQNDMTIAAGTQPEPSLGDRIDDASITAQVKFALLTHRSTSAVHTSATTTDGVVTLTGTAKNQAEKDLATKLVRDINGVKDVHNNMTIEE